MNLTVVVFFQELIHEAFQELKSKTVVLSNESIQLPVRLYAVMLSLSVIAYMEPLARDCKKEFIVILFKSISLEYFDFSSNGTEFMNMLQTLFNDESKRLVFFCFTCDWHP